MMTRKTCESIISKFDDVEEIRYIILTSKIDVNCNKEQLPNYSFTCFNNCNRKIGLKSMLIKPDIANELIHMGNVILRSVIHNLPDSFLGISIIADAPECNDAMLNIKRPGVLRQYYGMDIEKIDDNITKRVAYRSQTSFTSEGSDPLKLVVKPFPDDMIFMSEFFSNFLIANQKQLNLEDVDLSNKFNSCTLLIYHSLDGIKKQSSMGWHCDSKYSVSGKFITKRNGQMYNTPVLIFTIGKAVF